MAQLSTPRGKENSDGAKSSAESSGLLRGIQNHQGKIASVLMLGAAGLFVALRDETPRAAHDEFDDIGRMVAEHDDTVYWKAMDRRREGKVDEAIALLEDTEMTEKNAILLYQLHKQRGDVPRQIATLRGILAGAPDSTHVSGLLASVYEENGQADEAVKVLEEAVPHVKNKQVPHQNLVLRIVRLLESQGLRDEAVQRLQDAGPDLAYWHGEKLRALEQERR